MLLYLIRHGIAVERGTDALPDAERPLTSKGIRRVRQNARGLHRLGIELDAIWTSPLKRAHQTAELMAQEFALTESLQEVSALEPGSAETPLIELLRREPKDAKIALVGHEPHLGQLAVYLLTGLKTAAIDFKKGAVVCIEIDGFRRRVRGQLLWFATPAILRRIKKPA